MSDASIILSKDEYDVLKTKAALFDRYVESEELSAEELAHIKKALKGSFLSKKEFLNKHPELS